MEPFEQKIEDIVTKTLGELKQVFSEAGMSHRDSTLSLHYFIGRLCKNGWKGQRPSVVMKESIKITKSVGADSPLN